jgi:signal transduction histidine kinase
LSIAALTRIATHLVDNAVKFTEAGGRVDVRLVPAAHAVTLTVADTGVGIDEAFLPKLFRAFEQESTGNGRAYEGAGLGLTITSHLVDLVGGALHVASVKGEGTTVTVRLPSAAWPYATPGASPSGDGSAGVFGPDWS